MKLLIWLSHVVRSIANLGCTENEPEDLNNNATVMNASEKHVQIRHASGKKGDSERVSGAKYQAPKNPTRNQRSREVSMASSPSSIVEQGFRRRGLSNDIERPSKECENIRAAARDLTKVVDENAALREKLKEMQNIVKKTTGELETCKNRWKKVATQLNRLQTRGKGMHHVTDGEIVRLVRQLRYRVHSFSIQYFNGAEPHQTVELSTSGLEAYVPQSSELIDYSKCMFSKEKGPVVLKSFLWRYLVGEVFDKFFWIPSLCEPMAVVCEALRPSNTEDNEEDLVTFDEEEKFHNWKASTSALILESLQKKKIMGKSSNERKVLCGRKSSEILDFLSPLSGNLNREILLNELQLIVDNAISLDGVICRQESSFYWHFEPLQYQVPFNPDLMQPDWGEPVPEADQSVDLVTAPALVKIRKQTGKDNVCLVEMAVSCTLSSPDIRVFS